MSEEWRNELVTKGAAADALGDEPEVWTERDEYAQGLNNQWHYDRNAIKAVPSAQPKSSELKRDSSDTISRQDAIMAVKMGALSAATLYGRTDEGSTALYETVRAIKAIPSAQPEIIRCRDCRHMQEDKIFHQCWCNGREVKYDDFCSYAERKEDETNSRNKTC